MPLLELYLPVLPGAAIAVLFLLGALTARRELKALVRIEPGALDRPLTVIIPARNEADRLGATLDALLADPSEHLRVWVFDDGSTDETPTLVRARSERDPRLTLLSADELEDDVPRDGFGKPIALARALVASSTPSEVVLFMDADVVLRSGALAGLLNRLEQDQADALSGVPELLCGSAIEAMLVPAFVSTVSSRHRPSRVHDDSRPDAFLNGQLILVRREALEAVGGWAAVRHTVLEDVALARALKAAGKRLRLADLRSIASTRMYTSLAEIRQGFGKNAVPLHGGALKTLLLGVASMVVAWTPWVFAAFSWVYADGMVAVGATAALFAVMVLQAGIRREAGVPTWPVLLIPLFYPFVAFVFAEAGLKGLTGGSITWKGRRYAAESNAAESNAAESNAAESNAAESHAAGSEERS